VSNFEQYEELEPFYPPVSNRKRPQRKDINFIGYTFKREVEFQQTGLTSALQELDSIKSTTSRESQPKNYIPTSEELYNGLT